MTNAQPPPAPSVETGQLTSLKFGFSGPEAEALDPNRLLMVVAADKSSGKSYFFQSNPDAFIFNFDCKPISYKVDGKPVSLAATWPLFYNGHAYHSPGKHIPKFGWDNVVEVHRYLLDIAGTADAPAMVVLDTVTAMRELLKRWLPTQYSGKERFEQLGEGGWARLNAEVARFVDELVYAGYGVALNFHVRRQYFHKSGADVKAVGPGDLATEIKRTIDTSSGQWSALQSKPTLVAGLIRERKRVIEKGLPVDKGWVTELDLGGSGRFDDCFGSMHNLPDIITLPADDPWGHFARVFKEHNS